MIVEDLGTMPYRQAWAHQERVHADVVAGGEERLLLVEHPPVITVGRRPNVTKNLLASPESLAQRSVEFVESDRGGDITFHGPGQLVAYPIVRLIDHQLSVGGYVRRLEQVVIDTLAELGIAARKDECAVGVWVDDGAVRPGSPQAGTLAKICALGVRIRRGVSMHGIALNVTTDLSYFDLIVPCGLSCRPVTSIEKLRGTGTAPMQRVKQALTRHLMDGLRINREGTSGFPLAAS
ncbi:MAG: lipoyl(octanoyl) transferase LipB, partial [Tepidisphaeraceae bacterium]